MANSFEFLPRPQRRLAMPTRMPLFLSALIIATIVSHVLLQKSTELSHQNMLLAQNIIVDCRNQIASEVKSIQFDPTILIKLKNDIELHNYSLNQPRTAWYKLFSFLEKILPDDAVISRLENPKTHTMVFEPGNVHFLLGVTLPDLPAVNSLFRRLNELPLLKNLTFDQQGERVYQNRKGVAVQVGFMIEGKND